MFDQIVAKQVICKVAVNTEGSFEIDGNCKRPSRRRRGHGVRIKISSEGDSKSLKSENTARQRDDLLELF